MLLVGYLCTIPRLLTTERRSKSNFNLTNNHAMKSLFLWTYRIECYPTRSQNTFWTRQSKQLTLRSPAQKYKTPQPIHPLNQDSIFGLQLKLCHKTPLELNAYAKDLTLSLLKSLHLDVERLCILLWNMAESHSFFDARPKNYMKKLSAHMLLSEVKSVLLAWPSDY